MRILLLTTWFPPAVVGSGVRCYEVGRRLAKRHEVHVFTTGIEDAAEEDVGGMYVRRWGTFAATKSAEREAYLLNLRFSINVLRRLDEDYDIIDCNIVSKILPFAAYYLSKVRHTPLVETWHEVWHTLNFSQYPQPLSLAGFFLELLLPRLARAHIAVSETTRRRLVSLLGADPHSVFVVSNGVDLAKIKKTQAERKYGRILYAGRLEKHKRVDVLIKAYKRIKRTHPEAELVIVGTGSERERLRELASSVEGISFYERLPYEKLIELMKSAWMFVLPSIREGQGIVLLEAMAAGTPPVAVAAEGSGVVDVIRDGYNGLLASETPESLEHAIRRLLADEELHSRLRAGGLRFVKAYDWDVVASMVERIYKVVSVTGG
ncbi:MAG: hypothetical protein DRN91_02090 [Candidatus Alkanophagales archaeon]|nr:MAG: hypothetical protein DRN91_02090 [Candidatus Alkanophagales archaeon]